MKILGVGVDLVKNNRIKTLIKNKAFILRTYGKNEIKFAKNILNKSNYFSKRFAAKEAFAKALGTVFRNNLNFKDIEILNDKLGKPYYLKSDKINSIVNKIFKTKKYNLFLSISDEKDYSVAFTIVQVNNV
jgi:holo-[acyl-carrier protein] synthase